MKDNKYKILFFMLLGLVCGIIVTGAVFLVINSKQSNDKNLIKKSIKEESKSNKKDNNNEQLEREVEEYNNLSDNTDIYETVDNSINSYNEEDTVTTDNEVLTYFKNKEKEISLKIKDGTYKDKAKNIFIEVIDFLFYDGKIKGHTFRELTGKGKLEVIKIAIKIEDKIEQYQPGLIDSIGSKYSNIKSQIINLYEEKTNEYCLEHENLCLQAKKDFNSVKNSFKNAFSTVKNKLSNFYQEKIK